jgi:hypothetical protein
MCLARYAADSLENLLGVYAVPQWFTWMTRARRTLLDQGCRYNDQLEVVSAV